jgi:bifunctional non-homologous end joining protein LigD
MSVLSAYRSKRDFSRTREPQGGAAPGVDGTFVVQKHAARRLHYDFRLGIEGVLVSWAVTKGPSLDPGDKRLAVRTEDHPPGYADFEGTIPRKEYGGGTVMLWDRGTFTAEGDPAKGLAAGKLKLRLAGSRLKGGFALVRMGGKAAPKKQGEKRENWLLIKERDGLADPAGRLGSDDDRSVTSGRSMEEIATGAAARKHRRPKEAEGTGKAAARRLTKKKTFVKPQLATLVEDPPEGDGWIFETKFDGYRLIAACDGAAVRCFTRSGKDWTARLPVVAEALARLKLKDTLLDGELVVTDADGFSDFGALQAALKNDPQRLSLMVFDILRDKGRDLRGLPLKQRKQRLSKSLGKLRSPLHLADYATGKGEQIAAAACRHGLEGIIAKRADAPYKSRRSRDWLKFKCVKEQEFVVGGWSPSSKSRAFSSLLLGLYDDDGKLHYAGRVGSGFDDAQLREIAAELKKRARKTAPFGKMPGAVKRGARWVTPDLVAQVRFAEITRDGAVRHAVFQGLREDKDAAEVVAERPAPEKSKKGKPMAGSKGEEAAIAGVRLTHPDKPLYPAMGVTKRELADYFAGIAEAMLPEVTDRPVSLLRCPDGRGEACFFQKHAGSGLPEPVRKIAIAEKDGARKDYLLFNSTAALVACAQVGALELHLWASRRDKLERPDRMVFDLDPGEGVDFAAVRAAAADLRDVLREAELESWPLLTGGKGIHLVIALERRVGWETFSGFAKAFAEKMSELDPDRFIATMSKAKRKGRIFIDHFRNRRGSTAIAPFSPRAREGAPVAVPVSWKELESVKQANAFTLANSLADLKKRAKAWPEEAKRRVRLTQAGADKLGIDLAE